MEMTVGEILTSYRQAADKSEQVKILAELNLCKMCDIERILAKNGYEVPRRKGVNMVRAPKGRTSCITWDDAAVARLEGYVREGLSNLEIADRFGTTEKNISVHVTQFGLGGLRKRKKAKKEEPRSDAAGEDIDSTYVKHLEQELKTAVHGKDEAEKQLLQVQKEFEERKEQRDKERARLEQEAERLKEKQEAFLQDAENAASLLHLVLCSVKAVRRQAVSLDDAVLRGVAVGVANAIVLLKG